MEEYKRPRVRQNWDKVRSMMPLVLSWDEWLNRNTDFSNDFELQNYLSEYATPAEIGLGSSLYEAYTTYRQSLVDRPKKHMWRNASLRRQVENTQYDPQTGLSKFDDEVPPTWGMDDNELDAAGFINPITVIFGMSINPSLFKFGVENLTLVS